jgi:hypothetical protein
VSLVLGLLRIPENQSRQESYAASSALITSGHRHDVASDRGIQQGRNLQGRNLQCRNLQCRNLQCRNHRDGDSAARQCCPTGGPGPGIPGLGRRPPA